MASAAGFTIAHVYSGRSHREAISIYDLRLKASLSSRDADLLPSLSRRSASSMAGTRTRFSREPRC